MIDTNLIHGDFVERIKDIPDDSIDLILTDPPYGTTHLEWDSVIDFEIMWRELERVRKPNAPVMLFGIEPFSTYLRMSNIKNWHHDVYWNKKRPSNFLNLKTRPGRVIEVISVFRFCLKSCYNHGSPSLPNVGKHEVREKGVNSRGVATRLNFKPMKTSMRRRERGAKIFPKDNIHFARPSISVHPTQKPVALLEYLLKIYSNPGDTVLDFTMGSGSTGVACVRTDRNFIGIEIDQKYYDIARERIDSA